MKPMLISKSVYSRLLKKTLIGDWNHKDCSANGEFFYKLQLRDKGQSSYTVQNKNGVVLMLYSISHWSYQNSILSLNMELKSGRGKKFIKGDYLVSFEAEGVLTLNGGTDCTPLIQDRNSNEPIQFYPPGAGLWYRETSISDEGMPYHKTSDTGAMD